LITGEKSNHLNSQIEDLIIITKRVKNFGVIKKKRAKNTSSNMQDIPVAKLFGHFQNLPSPINLLSL